MDGIATVTIATSRIVMKNAAPTTARTHQRCVVCSRLICSCPCEGTPGGCPRRLAASPHRNRGTSGYRRLLALRSRLRAVGQVDDAVVVRLTGRQGELARRSAFGEEPGPGAACEREDEEVQLVDP